MEIFKKATYFLGSMIAVGMILWSFLEENFYTEYVEGHFPLHLVVYGLPWAMLFAIWYHFYLTYKK